MITCLQTDIFAEYPSVRHGFYGSTGGVSTGVYATLNAGVSSTDAPQAIAENRKIIAAHMGVADHAFLSCQQVHSPDVVTVDAPFDLKDRPSVDAMVTRTPGIALGALSADCVPILFYAPQAGVIGATHAGWRGAVGGVIENTLVAMENLGAARAEIRAAIGPCIWQASYEVGPAFPVPFLAERQDNAAFFIPSTKFGHFMFDLPGYVAAKLGRLGLTGISPSPADTAAHDGRFFSYRRNCLAGDTKTGCQASVIMLAG